MQTEQTKTKNTSSSGQLETARAQLARLNEAATDAQAEAERWRVAFEREPTAQAHTESVVAAQRAVNAKAAAETFERETLQPLETAARKAVRDRFAAELDHEMRETEQAFEDAGRAFVQAAGLLSAATQRLGSVHDRRQAAQRASVAIGALEMDHFVARANAAMDPLMGSAHEIDSRWAKLNYAGSNDVLTLHFRMPAGAPSVFR